MKIAKHTVVALSYELKVKGEMVDKADADRPLEFIQGTGNLLPKFEANIEGLEVGDKFSFTLNPEDGYGLRDEQRVIDLPIQAFEIDGVLREDLLVEGTSVPLMNSMGQYIPARVVKRDGDKVKMDINHPMAGCVLDFTGEVLSVREATEQELSEGLQKGCGGCGGCHGEGEGKCHKEGGCHGEGKCHEEGGCDGKGHGEGKCHGEGGHEGRCCGKGKGKCHKD